MCLLAFAEPVPRQVPGAAVPAGGGTDARRSHPALSEPGGSAERAAGEL